MKAKLLWVVLLSGVIAPLTASAQSATLLTTIPNPTPAAQDWFGSSVAALGSDRVLSGAYSDNTSAPDAGAAYLFSANGTLLTTFTNPTPADYDAFGCSVAAVGSDRALIGAYGHDTGATDTGAARRICSAFHLRARHR